MTDPERVERLLVLMTLALVWAVRVGVLASVLEPIEVKSHGRPVLSVFKFGLRMLLEVLAGGSRLLSFSEVVAALFDTNGLVLEPCYSNACVEDGMNEICPVLCRKCYGNQPNSQKTNSSNATFPPATTLKKVSQTALP